ncbi:nucleotidyltransferase domain-containing protein [Salisaeta longa]|uniref:nucleotidyltransferase domain-containing protein n=1 Tax=Salisaeta longa TaxID=503170 RepID=UPI0003B6AAE7|nr:hypothetical protein [Salisaeta longa]
MATIQLPTEFSELLKLLNAHEVKYLIVGGYAVAYHGYPPTTGDIDIWIESTENNGKRIVAALAEFGFNVPALQPALFTKQDQIIRMGHPPLRVEILTSLSGVVFGECYRHRTQDELGGVATTLIGSWKGAAA